MNKFVLFLCFSLLCRAALAHPQDELSPEELMHYYVRMFNEENLAALQDVYHFPHARIRSGRLTYVESLSGPVIDFDELKKAGWKYSKINHVTVLAEGNNAALVEMNFSRFNADGNEYLVQTAFYSLTKNKGYWQIICLQNIGASSGNR